MMELIVRALAMNIVATSYKGSQDGWDVGTCIDFS